MKVYKSDDLRNIALVGHSNTGKTTLTEAILHSCGCLKELGSVEDRDTVSDYRREEKDRGISIKSSLVPVECMGKKINILDTPGYFDFIGEVYSSLAASEAAVLVVDAGSGVEVATEKIWKELVRKGIPRLIFVNKMDRDNIKLEDLLEDLRENLGESLVPFNLPIGKGASFSGVCNLVAYEERDLDSLNSCKEKALESLNEKVAESCDSLLEKYFEGEDFTYEEKLQGLRKSILSGDLSPVVFGSAEKLLGVEDLMKLVVKYMPSPLEIKREALLNEEELILNHRENFSGLVFKTIIDPFVGKLSFVKILSGSIGEDTSLYNIDKEVEDRFGKLITMRGKEQIDLKDAHPGDIVIVSKLEETETGDLLSDRQEDLDYRGLDCPSPVYFKAIEPRKKSDEDKIGSSLNKLCQEDPSFKLVRNSETQQLLIGGQGNMQLEIMLDKLKNDFGVEVDKLPAKVAYRETITRKVEVQGKHKKQSGGAGQYGDVFIRFEPSEEEFEFEEEVFGGAVPKNYFPAVEKGLEESLEEGVLAGYPVVNIKATLFDGSHHPVDSNEMAFKIAASMALREGLKQAKPTMLEPIMKIEVRVPEEYMGDILGDLTKRRGRILGMDSQDGDQILVAEVPEAELFEYAIDLRSMTQGRGDFSLDFLRYDNMPKELIEELLEK